MTLLFAVPQITGGLATFAQRLTTLDKISKMMISILGIVGEMEKTQTRERQLEGIKLAKLKGVYKGRVTGSKEDIVSFL